ncbi:MAG TPA: Gfo/Idh/MocA family oxidoreductase [Solirubrobacteraceae bacterium]|nr:Gfo/Idh/MocA family oxidoreductase [Solirubrobacteraceae bacterium]
MEGTRLRAGVVGPGTIGELHVRTLRSLGIQVRALVASSLESAKGHAQRLEIEHVYDSVAAMAGSGEVDVVHVCTPNVLHASAATQALEGGCDVVCEKPLTFDLATADDLLRMVESAGAKGGVCYHYRCLEGIAVARSLVQSGALGSVRMLAGRYLSQELRDVPAAHWLTDAAIVGPSRSLADVGVHWFDLAEHVSGQSIKAVLAQPAGTSESEPFLHGAAVLLRLEEDTPATVVVSQDCFGVSQDEIALEVQGSAGTLRWSLDEDGERLIVWREDGSQLERTMYAKSFQAGTERAFQALMSGLYDRIQGGQSPAPTFADGQHGVAILHAAVQSAAQGGWVEVPPTVPLRS